MNKAVCVLIEKDGLFLAVSRKNNPHDFGLPGGKVDPGETEEQALRREVLEETGIQIGDIRRVFEDICKSDRDSNVYSVTTFVTDTFCQSQTSYEKGVIAWVDKDRLLAGSFGKYNKKLFDALS